MKRTLAILAAIALSFVVFVSPARAASAEATKAADWIVANHTQSGWTPGTVADDVLALASTGDTAYNDEIFNRLTYLKAQAASYIASGDAVTAAKLAIVAAATGQDASDFGGQDLIALVQAGIGGDGSIGDWPGPFSSGIAMVALARNGETIPSSMVTYLLTYRSADGGFTWATGESTYDTDMTALAILGLQAAQSTDPALADALAFVATQQQPDGSWSNYSPVNSTGLLGPLMTGAAATNAADYVVSQQVANGGLKTGASGANDPDLLATQQGILALTGETFLTITYTVTAPTATPTSTQSGSTSPTATTTGSPTTTATSTATGTTASATASSTASGEELADTGADVGAGLLALSVVTAGAGTALLVRRKPRA
ncbi:prenyltransferase/squalene oxidase repeat-containing protein [Propionicicella superfundia]|uniref:prenyltransferase/squalene oxidase repeat-containing protein n=1 Tax=Propionicicella superfundia TaxID=348582 RepID=UPI0004029600|nr:prenyltransferase/squalene oxidase repeat-containing protein [Propionicicella superfundia]